MLYSHDEVLEYYSTRIRPMYEEYIELTNQKIPEVNERVADAMYKLNEKNYDDAMGDILVYGITVANALLTYSIKRATLITKDKEKLKWCARAPKQLVVAKLESAVALNNQANKAARNNGHTSALDNKRELIELSCQARAAYSEWIELFDPELLDDFAAFSVRQSLKNHAIGFGSGVIASIVASFAFAWYTASPTTVEPNPGQPAASAALKGR